MKKSIMFAVALFAAVALLFTACPEEPGETGTTEWNVIFNTDGGNPAIISPIKVKNGEGMGSKYPANPSKEGYAFVGWYEGETLYDNQTPITKHVTLKASWDEVGPDDITITFDTDGGTPNINNVVIPKGASMDDVQKYPGYPTKANHQFGGWYEVSDTGFMKRILSSTRIDDDMDLIARWIPEITITFDLDGGRVGNATAIPNATIVKGDSLGAKFPAQMPVKQNNGFDGWYKVIGTALDTTPVNSETTFDADTTIKIKWIPQVTIVFHLNGGKVGELEALDPVTITRGTALGAKFPGTAVRENWDFEGWFYDDDYGYENEIEANTLLNKSGVLLAHFTFDDANFFEVEFHSDCGTDIPAILVPKTNPTMGDQYPDDPVWAGREFDGWYSHTDTTFTTKYDATTTITDDTELVAKWIRVFQVTFNANGGTPAENAEMGLELKDNDSVDLTVADIPVVTRALYTLDGWAIATYGSPVITLPYTVTDDIELFAIWTYIGGEIVIDSDANTLTHHSPPIGSVASNGAFDGTITGSSISYRRGAFRYAFPLTIADVPDFDINFYDVVRVYYTVDAGSAQGAASGTTMFQYNGTSGYTVGAVGNAWPWLAAGTQLAMEVSGAGTGSPRGFSVRWTANDLPLEERIHINITITRIVFNRDARYTVSFDLNGGDGNDPESVIIRDGFSLGAQLPIVTKTVPSEVWIFDGWEDQDGNPVTSITAITKDTTLSAQWLQITAPIVIPEEIDLPLTGLENTGGPWRTNWGLTGSNPFTFSDGQNQGLKYRFPANTFPVGVTIADFHRIVVEWTVTGGSGTFRLATRFSQDYHPTNDWMGTSLGSNFNVISTTGWTRNISTVSAESRSLIEGFSMQREGWGGAGNGWTLQFTSIKLYRDAP